MGTRYKIHTAGKPGRPIVSSSGSPMQRIPQFINYHLQSLVLPEAHHRPSSRDLTTRPPSTRKHPGHTQCLKNGFTMCCSWLSYAEELAQLDNSERKHFNHPDHSTECLEVMGAEKHTRTISCHAVNNRKATGPLN